MYLSINSSSKSKLHVCMCILGVDQFSAYPIIGANIHNFHQCFYHIADNIINII